MICEKVFLDTNKYIQLALGKLSTEDIKKKCTTIFLNEFNIFEVIAKTKPSTFSFQKEVVNHFDIAADLVDTVPNHLRDIWGLPKQSKELSSLKTALSQFKNAKTYLDAEELILYTEAERNKAYKSFAEAVGEQLADWKLEYQEKQKNFTPELKGKTKKQNFKNIIFSEEEMEKHLLRSRTNAYRSLNRKEDFPPAASEIESARKRTRKWSMFYAQYLVHSIEVQPEFNDRADVALAHYLDEGFCIITDDKKTLTIARDLNFENEIFSIP